MEGIQTLVQNLSSSYFLALSTLIAASLVALFYGIKNAEEDEFVEKNGKRYRKKKPPAFYLPCSLNQECLFEDDEEEPAEEEKAPTSKAAAAEKKIKSQLTPEELKKEQITQQIQLSEIYKLMQEQSEKFGTTSYEDVEDQLKMYRM